MKKILKKIFRGKSPISNWLLILVVWIAAVMFITIMDMGKIIRQEQYMRICPEPYVCVIPPENWKKQVPMGLTIYKRIPV
jgi:hypothetical protein